MRGHILGIKEKRFVSLQLQSRTVDVANAVQFQTAGPDNLQLLGFDLCCCWVAATGPSKPDLVEFPIQHFHEAMRIGVIVNGRAVALAPAEQHQVELSVTFVHQISRIPKHQMNVKFIANFMACPGDKKEREVSGTASWNRFKWRQNSWICSARLIEHVYYLHGWNGADSR